MVMVFNATSVLSLLSALLVEETGGPGENLLDEMLNSGIKMWDIYIYNDHPGNPIYNVGIARATVSDLRTVILWHFNATFNNISVLSWRSVLRTDRGRWRGDMRIIYYSLFRSNLVKIRRLLAWCFFKLIFFSRSIEDKHKLK